MYAAINGTRIYYDVDGAGVSVEGGEVRHKPVIFILHGGPGGCHLNFKPYLDELTKTAQLVYVDQRGCGYSDPDDPEKYTLDQNVEDVEALRQHLGVERIWILGHSYGGMVAMSYAIRHQEHTAGLILAATSPSHNFLEKAKQHVKEHGNAEQMAVADVLWEGKFESQEQLQEYYRVMAPMYSTKTAKTESLQETPANRPAVKRNYEALNKGFGDFLLRFDVREELKSLKVLTLIIAGRHDWITHYTESEEMHRLIPGSELQIMEHSSHNLFADDTSGTNELMADFLAKHA
ncbi:alpha/beta fold hydrolase [Bhargavaea ullalensis]|uniref:Proline iminopeptidase n=1 Tax=Bhargavaea ullalensis TaxID=1265685 RepID=A0ABV2GCV9_9BACL